MPRQSSHATCPRPLQTGHVGGGPMADEEDDDDADAAAVPSASPAPRSSTLPPSIIAPVPRHHLHSDLPVPVQHAHALLPRDPRGLRAIDQAKSSLAAARCIASRRCGSEKRASSAAMLRCCCAASSSSGPAEEEGGRGGRSSSSSDGRRKLLLFLLLLLLLRPSPPPGGGDARPPLADAATTGRRRRVLLLLAGTTTSGGHGRAGARRRWVGSVTPEAGATADMVFCVLRKRGGLCVTLSSFLPSFACARARGPIANPSTGARAYRAHACARRARREGARVCVLRGGREKRRLKFRKVPF